MKTVNITYFVHGTTTDNESGIATGWNPGKLSELGKKQSIELRNLIKDRNFDVAFCSDLKRSVDSAKLTFGNRIPVVRDKRLRECNYGDWNGAGSEKVEAFIKNFDCINEPFPNGESYQDVEVRMRDFLDFLLEKYYGKNVAIVGHRAPQLALEVLINNKPWRQAIMEDWRFAKAWKPGWDYKLKG